MSTCAAAPALTKDECANVEGSVAAVGTENWGTRGGRECGSSSLGGGCEGCRTHINIGAVDLQSDNRNWPEVLRTGCNLGLNVVGQAYTSPVTASKSALVLTAVAPASFRADLR